MEEIQGLVQECIIGVRNALPLEVVRDHGVIPMAKPANESSEITGIRETSEAFAMAWGCTFPYGSLA